MTFQPRVSVVLPVRDAADTLPQALDSILSQDESNLELLAVDDGSIDETPTILLDYSSRDSRLRVLSSEGGGVVDALNIGLCEARAPYIARMDADDVSLPQRLKLQCDFLDVNREVGLVSSKVKYWQPSGETGLGYALFVDWINGLTNHAEIQLGRFVESPLAHPSVVFRKSLVEAHGGYENGLFPEDYELWLRWLEQGVRMEKLSEVLLLWRDSDDRLSRVDPRYASEAFYKMKIEYLARWLRQSNRFQPNIMVWGAGRKTRSRSRLFAEHGIEICGFFDVAPRKIGSPRVDLVVLPIDEIPEPGKVFIVGMVASRGARERISLYLSDRGYRHGVDFILAA